MILVNGLASTHVPADDRGLSYGDGVFRTLVLQRGIPRWWDDHYRKLEHDCAILSIPCPGKGRLRAELDTLAQAAPDAVAKIIITRGSGERGYAPAPCVRPTRIVLSFPLPSHPPEFAIGGVNVRFCNLRVAHQPALAGVKHLNRLENVLARSEWRERDIAEGLLLDAAGNVVGGTMTNLFIVEDGGLATPDLRQCGVAGVTRDRLISAAAKHGVPCGIENITVDRMLQAREAFLTNSVIGIWPIQRLGDERLDPPRIAGEARRWLDEEDR